MEIFDTFGLCCPNPGLRTDRERLGMSVGGTWGVRDEKEGCFLQLKSVSAFQNILPTFQFSPDKNPTLGMGTKMFGECKEFCERKRKPLYFLLCN